VRSGLFASRHNPCEPAAQPEAAATPWNWPGMGMAEDREVSPEKVHPSDPTIPQPGPCPFLWRRVAVPAFAPAAMSIIDLASWIGVPKGFWGAFEMGFPWLRLHC
jgi:hypothetical protein